MVEDEPKRESTLVLLGGWGLWWRALFGLVLCLTWAIAVYSWIFLALHPGVVAKHVGFAEMSAESLLFKSLRLVVFSGFAVVLVWKASRERIAVVLATLFLGFGGLGMVNNFMMMPSDAAAGVVFWRGLAASLLVVAISLVLLMPLLLPDGRLFPSWSRFGVPALVGVAVAYVAVFWQRARFPMDFFGLLAGLILLLQGFQIHRYRAAASYQQKQQIKSMLLGVVWGLSVQLFAVFVYGPPSSNPTVAQLWGFHIGVILSYLIALSGFVVAVLRFRLWDLDLAIYRSLVSATLGAMLLGLFFGAFWGLRWGLQGLFGEEQAVWAAVLATIPVAGAFQPAFRGVRRFVDHKIYGIAIDYRELQDQSESRQPAPKALEQETILGEYAKLSVLGSGGMGEVFLARRKGAQQLVAIKMLHRDEKLPKEELHKRFVRESQTLHSLEHPNIVSLLDFGEYEGALFMVMEYVDGEGLDALLHAHGRFTLAELRPFLEDLASALDYAHKEGVIHRDIKPSNIMLARRAGPISDATGPLDAFDRAVLMDFGIARVLSAMTQLTQEGKVVGTAQFIAPEQIRGAHLAEGFADIYSLGAMTYYLLTARLPFYREHFFSMMMAHLSQPPPDPRLEVPDLPEAAALAIVRAMSKNPHQRFATASAFVEALYAPNAPPG